MKYCPGCGAPVEDQKRFCANCGRAMAPTASEPQMQPAAPAAPTPVQSPMQSTAPSSIMPPPVQSATPSPAMSPHQSYSAPLPPVQEPVSQASFSPPTAQGYQAMPVQSQLVATKKKGRKGKIIGLICGAVGLTVVAVVVINLIALAQIQAKKARGTPTPTALAALVDATPKPSIISDIEVHEEALEDNSMNALMSAYFGNVVPANASYTADDVIFPALYRSRSHLVTLTATSPTASEALLTVEVLGFTHKYEQKIRVTPLGTNIQVLPAMLDGVLETCNTSKKGQLQVTLTDMDTGKSLLHETKEITIQSMYDLQFIDFENQCFLHNYVCAWVTPEDPIIRTWQRDATDVLSVYTDGEVQSFIGYQGSEQTTFMQLVALYDTLANVYKVRYNMTPVSTSGNNAQQRVALPKDVINDRSGLCVETAAAMASAAEALSMNAYLTFLPGHSMTLVELQDQSTNYVLIETTALTFSSLDDVFFIGTDEEVLARMLEMDTFNVVNISNERRNGIHPMQ